MIVAKLKTLPKQTTMMVSYKVDMDCNGNIMPFNILKNLFPSTTENTLVTTKDTTTLRTYNSITITQLGRCGVVIENFNAKKCIFFIVPGDGDASLGMWHIELLNILQISCNTIDTKKEEKCVNYNKKGSLSMWEVSIAVQTQA